MRTFSIPYIETHKLFTKLGSTCITETWRRNDGPRLARAARAFGWLHESWKRKSIFERQLNG